MFSDMQKYLYSESVLNTLCIEIKHKALKNFSSEKINGTKNALFFLSYAPVHHSFALNLRSIYELKRKVHLSETACGIFHFRLRFVFMKVYFFVQQDA